MKTGKIFRCLLALMLFFAFAKNANADTVTYEFNLESRQLEKVGGESLNGVSVSFEGFEKSSSKVDYYVPMNKTGVIKFQNFDYKVSKVTMTLNFYGSTAGEFKINNGEGGSNFQKSSYSKSVNHEVNIYNKPLNGLNTISVSTYNWGTDKCIHVKSITIEYIAPKVVSTSQVPSSLELGKSLDLKSYLNIEDNGNTSGFATFLSKNQDYSISYSSSNASVLSVDKNGKLQALADGNSKITVSLNKNGNQVSKYETTVYVSRFVADNSCYLKSYHCHATKEDDEWANLGLYNWDADKHHNEEKISVSELVHTGDYTFEKIGEAKSGDFYKLGTLLSSDSRRYRVGYQTMNLLSAYPYTKIKTKYSFKVDVSASQSACSTHGAELIIAKDNSDGTRMAFYNAMQLETTASAQTTSTSTLCRVVSTTSSVTTSDVKTKEVELNNSNGSNTVNYYFAMMAFTRHNSYYKSNNGNFTQTANFWYKPESSSVQYYAYVKYNKNDGSNTVSGETTLTSTDKAKEVALPKCSFTLSRQGKVFMGWNTSADGKGEYVSDAITPYDPATGGGRGHIILYAIWHDITNTRVVFHYTNTIQGKTLTVSDYSFYSQKYNNLTKVETSVKGYETPIRNVDGYVFDGWCDKEKNGEIVYYGDGKPNEGHYWAKDADGNYVWNSTQNEVHLYPQWIKDVTFAGVKIIRDNNYEGTNQNHRYVGVAMGGMTSVTGFKGKGYITVDGENFLSTIENGGADQVVSVPIEEAPIWTFEEEDGRYIIWTEVVENGETIKKYIGTKLLNPKDPSQGHKKNALGIQTTVPELRLTIYNEKGWICYGDDETNTYNHILYMKDDGTNVWEYEDTGDNPQYRPIRVLAYGLGVGYGNLNSAKVVETIKKELTKPEYAYNVGTTPSIDDPDLCKGLLYVDMGNAAKIIEENASDLVGLKNAASDNCLFFVPSNYNNKLGNNVVCLNGEKYEAVSNLVIKDKMPFSSPYTFHVGNGYEASYNRDFSKWSSVYIPFPAKVNGKLKLYELYGSDDLHLAYKTLYGDVIPANEVIACKGDGNYTLTNTDIDVAADPVDFADGPAKEGIGVVTCENIRKFAEDFANNHAKLTASDKEQWNAVGVRFSRYIYGEQYKGDLPEGRNVEQSLVYYFSGGNFSYVNPVGRVKFNPFRGYYQPAQGASMKSYSVIAIDTEEGATDITDVMTGAEAEGDGKIYDLQGRRVMNPLKGHIYIVNGKKKQY